MKPETLPKYRPYRHWPADQLDAFIETTSTDYLDAMYAEFEREYRAAERNAITPETHDWHETTAVDAFIAAMYRDYDNPTKVEQDASTDAIRNHYDDRRPVYIARAIARLESEDHS